MSVGGIDNSQTSPAVGIAYLVSCTHGIHHIVACSNSRSSSLILLIIL